MYLVIHKQQVKCDSPYGDDHDTTVYAITEIKIFLSKKKLEDFLNNRAKNENSGYWELIESEDESS